MILSFITKCTSIVRRNCAHCACVYECVCVRSIVCVYGVSKYVCASALTVIEGWYRCHYYEIK